jgi:hypothetical protein
LIPFVSVIASGLAIRLIDRHREFGAAAVGLMLTGGLILNVPWRADRLSAPDPWLNSAYVNDRRVFEGFRQVEELRKRLGSLLVLVNDTASGPWSPGFNRLSLYNRRGLTGTVVVAHDLGARNATLIEVFPDRTVVRQTWPAVNDPPLIEVIRPPLPARSSGAR